MKVGSTMGKLSDQEFSGDVKLMPDNILQDRLDAALKAATELEAERRRRESFTIAERLADRLHRLLHFTVECDYEYSAWPKPTGCRAEFRTLAENLLNAPDLGAIVHLMEVARFGPAL